MEIPAPSERTRVLVVEDEWIIATTLTQQLEACGYEVTGTMGTGTAALRTQGEVPADVILMDAQMPEMDGIRATHELMRSRPRAIVIVTGNGGMREAAERAGAMEHVMKPLLAHQLPALIGRAQARCARFLLVHQEEASCEAALVSWLTVQEAVRALVEVKGSSEEQAFGHLAGRAREAGRTLREEAVSLLWGLGSDDGDALPTGIEGEGGTGTAE
jgi:two-component system, response regulator / RNA-binding antiterminator